ncbi:MAG: hypothetical protein R6U17_09710 [Thermoplasmata archaeon]
MGFSISSTHLVFFIMSMVAASVVAGAFIQTSFSVRDSIVDTEAVVSEGMRTNIDIINDPKNVPNDPLLIYVKNTGSTSFNVSNIDVLVNGTYVSSPAISIVGSNDTVWRPMEVITIEIDIELPQGDHWVKVRAGSRADDDLKFSI